MNDNSNAIGASSLCVLILEDNEHMRQLLRRLLLAMGVRQIYEYADGSQALAEIRVKRPDFILADYSMEPMDGLEFTRAVRRLPDDSHCVVPIIMVTGHTERSRIQRARDAGVTEILAKPVTAAALYQRIELIVHKPRPFVRAPNYIGPCRRRRTNEDYAGPWRRKDDPLHNAVDVGSESEAAGRVSAARP
jgi:two-component system, chemotaxis family, chemotaxis protein CheY